MAASERRGRFGVKFAACLWLALATCRADLVLTQKVDGGGQSGAQTIRIKDGKSRADLAESMSFIADSATGDAFVLRHPDHSYLRIPAAQSKAMLDEIAKKRGNAPPPQLQPVGKKEKVGDYECEIFKCDLGGMTVKYWIAKDFPDFAAIQQQLSALQKSSLALGSQGLMPDPATFPGMTMKTEMELGTKKVTVTTLTVKSDPVDAAIFNLPGNYKESTLPPLEFKKK